MAKTVMRMDVMSTTELLILSIIACSILIACLVIGGTGPQANLRQVYSATQCSHPKNTCPNATFSAEECAGVAFGSGQVWTHTWTDLNILNGYWALAAFPVRNTTVWSVGQLQQVVMLNQLQILLTLEGKLPDQSGWTLIANQTESFSLYCPQASCTCDGWWLFSVGFLKYTSIRASVQLLNPTELIADMKFREQLGNEDYNNLRLGFHLSWLTVGVILFIVYLFVMRNHRWQDFTYEQKGSFVLLLALAGYNDPFFPFKFLVDSIAFPILGAIFEELFMLAVVLFWVLFYDRYRRAEGQAWNPWHWCELLKYGLVSIYFVLAVTLFSWVRSREQSHPIPGESLPTGIIVLFYLTALAFAGIFLYVIVLILIAAGPIQGRTRTYRRFLYITVPTVVVLVSVILGLFTNSLGPYGRSLPEFMYFFGLWNLYIWLLSYGTWPASGGFTTSNAYLESDDEDLEATQASESTGLLQSTPASLPEFLGTEDPSSSSSSASSSSSSSASSEASSSTDASDAPLKHRATYLTIAPTSSSTDEPFGAVARTDLGDDEGL